MPLRPEEEPIIPFANIEAEAALLGALMIDNRMVSRVAHLLEPEFFYEHLHSRIYRIIVKFVEAEKIANPVTLRPVFDNDRAMKQVGGAAYLAQLTGSGAALIGAVDFAKQIRDLAMIRHLQWAVDEGIESFRNDGDFDEILSAIEQAAVKASTSMRVTPVYSAPEMVGLTETRVNTSLEKGVPGAACKTIPDIDTLLGKLEGGQYTILAGRPGMGKSTTAVSAGLGYAMNAHPALYLLAESSAEMFSLKMTSDLLHAAAKEIKFKTLKEGILSNEERKSLEKVREIAATLPITFAHVGRTDVKKIEAMVAKEVLRLKRDERRLEVVIVDYLQLLTADGRHRAGDDRGRVNAVSEALLAIAQRYDVHVIALSQLNRAVDGREDKRPRLADLRESGRLEEDADNVLMVFRNEYYLEKSKPTVEKEMADWQAEMDAWAGKIELIAAKTRFGANASRKCNFLGDYSAVRGSNWHSMLHGDPADDDDLFERGFS